MIGTIKKHSPLPASDPQTNHIIKVVRCVSIELFKRLDEEKTRQNVDSLLLQYWRLLRIVGTRYEPKLTATYKFDVVSHSNRYQNPIDSDLIKKEEIWQQLVDIWTAYDSLNAYGRQLLYDKYFSKEKLVDYLIYPKYGYSERTFYRNLRKVSVEFAEAYEAFRHFDSLLAFKNGRKMAESWQDSGRGYM